LRAQRLGIERIRATGNGGSIEFGRQATLDPDVLLGLIGAHPERYRLDGPYKLRFSWEEVDAAERLGALGQLLDELGAEAPAPVYSQA
jgi:transcription-repair coupling factor (superfamily II helicase)